MDLWVKLKKTDNTKQMNRRTQLRVHYKLALWKKLVFFMIFCFSVLLLTDVINTANLEAEFKTVVTGQRKPKCYNVTPGGGEHFLYENGN